MAISTRTGSQLMLELDGKGGGFLRNAQPPSVRVDVARASTGMDVPLRTGVRISLGEMAAEADLLEPGPLFDWLAAALAGNLELRSGAVLQADHNYQRRRRIGFSEAQLTAIAWPALDASETKRAFTLSLRWLAGQVDDGPDSGKLTGSLPGKRKQLLTSNFRVGGLPFGGEAVLRVELPSFSVAWAGVPSGEFRVPTRPHGQVNLGELRLVVSARQAEAARAWVRKLIKDGQLDDSESLNLQVDMLDVALKKTLASFELMGCRLRGMDEEPLGSGPTEAPGRLSLRFAVDRLKPSLA